MSRIGAAFSIAMVLVVLLAFAAVITITFTHTFQAQSWPETECEILASRAFDPPNDESSSWDVAVSWRYQVDGVLYETHGRSPEAFGMLYSEEDARALAARYVVGKKVVCFYDPEDPRESALDRSPPPWSAIALAVAVGLALLGAAVAGIVVILRRSSS